MRVQVKVTVPLEVTDAEIPGLRDAMGVLTTPELKARIQEGAAEAAEDAINDYMSRLFKGLEESR